VLRATILHPAAPLLVGTAGVIALLAALLDGSATPAPLAHAHGRIPGLEALAGCVECHADDGMTAGCLGCHAEIQGQLDEGSGYHGYLADLRGSECADCHTEHHGPDFPLVNALSWGAQVESSFRHPHVDFSLEGAHEPLPCRDCHGAVDDLVLPGFESMPRESTYLGLDQRCIACHADEHSDGMTGECTACHDQEEFGTPHFDHTPFLSLGGGHDGLRCDGCHVLPPRGTPRRPLPFPFEVASGEGCRDCHGSPHRVEWAFDCSGCHAPDHGGFAAARATITPALHDRTGFPLSAPHERVPCEGCHPSELPFDERHPDPTDPSVRRTATTCEGCHEDVHRGQFARRYDHCIECHSESGFVPTAFGHDDHRAAFDLAGAHSAVACSSCHVLAEGSAARTFVGTSTLCRDCHEDPHAGQFAAELSRGDCDQCHVRNADRFTVGTFDHARRTGFDLAGAHAEAACDACHRETTIDHLGTPVVARKFGGTPTACADCHVDVHRGQFSDYATCDVCHTSQSRWSRITFDHTTQSAFPLTGAHAAAPCSSCHVSERHADGIDVVRYEPIPHDCGDCHEIEPKPGRP